MSAMRDYADKSFLRSTRKSSKATAETPVQKAFAVSGLLFGVLMLGLVLTFPVAH